MGSFAEDFISPAASSSFPRVACSPTTTSGSSSTTTTTAGSSSTTAAAGSSSPTTTSGSSSTRTTAGSSSTTTAAGSSSTTTTAGCSSATASDGLWTVLSSGLVSAASSTVLETAATSSVGRSVAASSLSEAVSKGFSGLASTATTAAPASDAMERSATCASTGVVAQTSGSGSTGLSSRTWSLRTISRVGAESPAGVSDVGSMTASAAGVGRCWPPEGGSSGSVTGWDCGGASGPGSCKGTETRLCRNWSLVGVKDVAEAVMSAVAEAGAASAVPRFTWSHGDEGRDEVHTTGHGSLSSTTTSSGHVSQQYWPFSVS